MAAFPLWYVHEDLSFRATGARIVQFARESLHCDRVTLLLPKGSVWRGGSRWELGGGWKAVHVSGVTKIHRHSTTIRSMQSASKVLLRSGRLIRFPSERELSPQEEAAIDQLLDSTEATSFLLLPLWSVPADSRRSDSEESTGTRNSPDDGSLIGALLCERFTGEFSDSQRDQLEHLISHCSIALQNARRWDGLPGRWLLSFFGSLISPLYRMKLGAFLLIACLTVVALMKAETQHWVHVRGELLPEKAVNLFSPSFGTVVEVLVEHGQQVEKDDLLLRLESSQLQRLQRQLSGDLQSSQQRLLAIKAQKIAANAENRGSESAYDPQLTEQLQLESNIRNLQSQLEIVQQEIERLEIRAPIDGRVTTWDLRGRLDNRPVSTGDLLLTLESTDQSLSRLKLKIPQSSLGPVLQAPGGYGQRMVRFRLASMPERVFNARLTQLATATQLDDHLGTYLPAEAIIESTDLQSIQSGATVLAQVECGTSSLGRAHFFAVYHWWHYRFLFWIGWHKDAGQ